MSRTKLSSCLWLALLALGAPGCTLLINGNQYVGNGTDAGPGDDGGPDHDGGPGVDSAVDASVDTGPHVNRPPVLLTVGLDNYRPMVGETVRALAGRTFDADGDATSVHYQWFVNGAIRSAATTATLDTHTLAPGDLIHVEAWANDGTVDGARVSTADVPTLTSTTRWRQLLPNEGDQLPAMVWDAPNQRAVRFADGGLWEYAIEGTAMRVSLLPTTGTPPPSSEETVAMLDAERHRMIIATSADPANIYSVDIAHRGGGAWTVTPTTGSSPSSLFIVTTFYDATTRRIFVVGGKDDTLGALSGFTALDVSSAGAESWHTITPSGTVLPPMFGATAVADATTPGRFYLIGGVTSTLGTTAVDPVYSMLGHVLQIDVTATDVHVTQLSASEPPSFGAVGAADPTNGHVIVYGGLTAFGATAALAPPVVYNPMTQVFTPVGGTLPHGALLGGMAPDPFVAGHFGAFTVGSAALTSDNGANVLQFDDVTETAVTPEITRMGPRAIQDAAARLDQMVVQIVGGSDGNNLLMQSWSLDMSTLAWSTFAPTQDPATMHSPTLRYGVVSDPTSLGSQGHLFQVGGARADGVLSDMAAFELSNGGGGTSQWLERTLSSGTAPQARVGAIVAPSNCGSGRLLIYGGEDASHNYLSDAAILNCSADHVCSWAPGTTTTARSYASAVTVNSNVYVFGGHGASGPMNDMFALQTCIGSTPMPMAVVTSGPAPTARYGHSMTAFGTFGGTDTVIVMFGGTDGTLAFSDTSTFVIGGTGFTGTWTPLAPAGDLPSTRSHHIAVPDDTGRRVIVIGGQVSATDRSSQAADVWELVFRS